ncbi:hypothetical protein TRP66_19535 [Pseudomonas sp. JDS28PS106]|uniref:hypothetical protein n=1 Tax=Pseudomonas sp. JDS28PS106 TaxID=2497235 RepID=UPI002FD4CEE6
MDERQAELHAAMAHANEIAERYEQAVRVFGQLYKVQRSLLTGTTLGHYLGRLDDSVREAVGLNIDAGWLPEGKAFTQQEYLHALIRRDSLGRRFPTVEHLPVPLWGDDDEPDDGSDYQALADELREVCRDAYSSMQELREIMDDEPTGEGLLDALYAWPTETHEPEGLVAEAYALQDNLYHGWQRCKAAGLGLLCMANQLGEKDLDHDAAIALME